MTNDIKLRKCVFCQTVKDEITGEVSKCNPVTGDDQGEESLASHKTPRTQSQRQRTIVCIARKYKEDGKRKSEN